MSNGGRDKGPVENEVEALRSMLEQRSREAGAAGSTVGQRSPDTSSGEEPDGFERENRDGDKAEPIAEENE